MTDKPPPEPDPDGWRRFERAVDVVFHTPPKHKAKPKPESKPEGADTSRR